jgi:hypothetical protein
MGELMGMKTLTIRRLISGGLITNYYCSSACRHCLYACSPKWEKKYIEEEKTAQVFAKILELGCDSIHIGGGEPLLNVPALEAVIHKANELGMGIEYIETNSSWYRDERSCIDILSRLRRQGIHTLLVSISPFHNEYIPYNKVKGVMAACGKANVSVFPWVREFCADLAALDDTRPHSLEEYCDQFGEDYMRTLPSRYWLNLRGRALVTYKDFHMEIPLEELLEKSCGCSELDGTSHFHIDLFGNYIPGLCSGLAVQVEDLGTPLEPQKYPLLTALYNKGITGLWEYAVKHHGYLPAAGYISKCHLCLDIRSYLVKEKQMDSIELQPIDYYHHI